MAFVASGLPPAEDDAGKRASTPSASAAQERLPRGRGLRRSSNPDPDWEIAAPAQRAGPCCRGNRTLSGQMQAISKADLWLDARPHRNTAPRPLAAAAAGSAIGDTVLAEPEAKSDLSSHWPMRLPRQAHRPPGPSITVMGTATMPRPPVHRPLRLRLGQPPTRQSKASSANLRCGAGERRPPEGLTPPTGNDLVHVSACPRPDAERTSGPWCPVTPALSRPMTVAGDLRPASDQDLSPRWSGSGIRRPARSSRSGPSAIVPRERPPARPIAARGLRMSHGGQRGRGI